VLRSRSIPATAMIVGCSLIAACSSSSKAEPPSTSPTTDVPISVGAGPTPAQLAFGKKFLAGDGASLVDFARKTKPISGPDMPSKAVCLDMKNNVLPSVAHGPASLEQLVRKITDPTLQKLFDQNIFWLNGLIDACSRTVVPFLDPKNVKVLFNLWAQLWARLGQYGITY